MARWLCNNTSGSHATDGANFSASNFSSIPCSNISGSAGDRSDSTWGYKPYGTVSRGPRASGSNKYACHPHDDPAVSGVDAFFAKFGKSQFI